MIELYFLEKNYWSRMIKLGVEEKIIKEGDYGTIDFDG